MRLHQGSLLHSASDLNAFLGCAHAAALNRRKLLDPASLPEKVADDENAQLVQQAGHDHEAAYLANLRQAGPVVEIGSKASLNERAAATTEAMSSGAPVIYQAAFLSAPWHGFADFLRKVEVPSALGAWSYEPADTKLARTASPKHVLQLALYSELIAAVQSTRPHGMHLILGDGREETFRCVEFQHTLNVSKERYIAFIERGAEESVAEPCAACSLCGWRDHCASQWEAADHLSRVAGMTKHQTIKLRAAGIDTMAGLATAAVAMKVPKLAQRTFLRLRDQAALQVARATGDPAVKLLEPVEGKGFARLPRPDPADLFFDLEGDPLYPDGLEYLWGVHLRDVNRAPIFKHFWGHDRDAERAAFEKTVDFFTAHLAAHPHAHIYHYAPYEVTVLRRLSTAFASREREVDQLLRQEKLVDLYAVVRAAIRTSEPDLSLKTLEIFFAGKRGEQIKKADQSIVEYHRWRETNDATILDGLLAYNRVDCENTEGLRDWLISLRPQIEWWTKPGAAPDPEKSESARVHEATIAGLKDRLHTEAAALSPRGRELMGHLLDFHWRAKKPELWAIFDRCERDEDELLDDIECIGGIRPFDGGWLRKEKRSTVARYRFPDQDTKLRQGTSVLHAPTRRPMGSIGDLDRDAGWVEVKRQLKEGESFPTSGALMPGWPIDTTVLEEAVERVTERLAVSETDSYSAIVHIIERRAPRITGFRGEHLVRPGESLIDAAAGRALALDHSALFIQGPPGTGKTFTSAHVICSLLRAGKRVGVSSNSHKAINNLLAKVEQVAQASRLSFRGAKKVSANDPDSFLRGSIIEDVKDAKDIEAAMPQLIGGTAWLFALPAFDEALDYLFVDEAGQVSLGHLIAMGSAARNIILVGDQMQLGQPIQGAHPGESGFSTLDYLLQGAATIAPDRGILLDTSWRMHPSICSFISEAVYDGRLRAHPHCEQQRLQAQPGEDPIINHGIRLVPMNHSGCAQSSEEECRAAANLIQTLLGRKFVDRDGHAARIGLENILVVAPYNLQVNALRACLPNGARVGTVDKFQGQEAEVVIASLATSTPEDLPRHVDFFYSKNRLNVAISRARSLAIVLANPRLLELDAKTVEHLRLVNTLAWLVAHATRQE